MPFQGAVVALVLILMPNVATVLWTNPNNPAIYRIDWYGQKAGDAPCSTRVAEYYGRGNPLDELQPPRLRPGKVDSLYLCMPQHTDSVRINFWWYGYDSLGNRITNKSAITSWLNRGRY